MLSLLPVLFFLLPLLQKLLLNIEIWLQLQLQL
jgi:hypothetical protein